MGMMNSICASTTIQNVYSYMQKYKLNHSFHPTLLRCFSFCSFHQKTQTKNSSNKYAFAFIMFWQNPKEADAMTKLQTDLDETKIILVSDKLGSIFTMG